MKTEADLADFTRILTIITVETALRAELRDHLGHDKHAESASGNYRNGSSSKRLIADGGCIEIDTPRDRHGSFEPQLVKKSQTRFNSMDDNTLSLYAKRHGNAPDRCDLQGNVRR